MMNRLTTATVFCIASLIATPNVSAQQCTNGQCRLHAQPAPSVTNLFRMPSLLPRLLPSRTPAYTGYNNNRSLQSNSACADGRCGVNRQPHNGAISRPSLPAPPSWGTAPAQVDDRDSAAQTPRPASETYRPVGYSRMVEWESDIRAAAERSRASGRPMLIQVSASWCGHCQQMKKETFTNQSLINGINRDFIAVMVDADSSRELVEKLSVKSLPTTLVVLPNLEVAERLEGFQSVAQLQNVLGKHLQRAQLDQDATVARRL